MLSRRLRTVLAAAIVVLASTFAMLAPGSRGGIAGLSTDTLFWLRQTVFGPRATAAQSPIALILIDENSYDTFKDLPKDFWAPFFGAAISAVDNAGAKLIGFDILLPLSIAGAVQSHPELGLAPTYDAPYLTALFHAAITGKLVMIKGTSGTKIITPPPSVMMPIGYPNIRFDTTVPDNDGIERHQPLYFPGGSAHPGLELGFAGELARRVGWTPDRRSITLNFDGGQPFETYSFSDIYNCAKTGNSAFFDRNFRGKIVLFATGNEAEDRHLTSRRFINQPEIMTGERCTPGPAQPPPIALPTIPGVLIHATAVDNLLHHDWLTELNLPERAAIVAAIAAIAAAMEILAPVAWSWTGLLALLVATVAAATALFEIDLVTPMLELLGAAILSFALLLGYRLLTTDRDRRRIREMFGMYLAPSVVERMVAADSLPERGGERRFMTFFFSDISGFTTLTESADPNVLSPLLNAYFDGVCDAIEKHGGVVIEFLGDGVQAMFGAPAEMPDHAARALAAARDVTAFTEGFRAAGQPRDMGFGHTRLGIHSGDALVGNIGASRRMKYAALGDVVNATSRLEGLNKYFGTRICISEEAVDSANEKDVRPLGDFLFVGKLRPVTVYELLQVGEAARPWVARYREAYAHLAAGDAQAVTLLQGLSDERPDDGCIRFHIERASRGELNTIIRMITK